MPVGPVMSRVRAGNISLAIAVLASACTGAPPVATTPPKPRLATPAKASPTPTPTTSVAPAPSQAPASPTASPTPAPLPSPTTLTASPAPGLTAAHAAMRDVLAEKLLTAAKVGFLQARAQLVSNNGAGIVANNGGSIITDNGTGIIANNGASYRLRQADPTIDPAARATEELVFDHRWADGSRYRVYRPKGAADLLTNRQIYETAAGVPTKEIDRANASGGVGAPRVSTEAVIHQDDAGAFRIFTDTRSEIDAADMLQRYAGTGRAKVATDGLALTIEKLDLDFAAGAGLYRYAFPSLGLVEAGTLTGLTPQAHGAFTIALLDPHRSVDGEARVETTAGTLVFTRRTFHEGATRKREYDLGEGLVVRLTIGEGQDAGELLAQGAKQADVTVTRHLDGTYVFRLVFPELPAAPVVIGYGDPAAASGVAAPEPTRKAWRVSTVGGAEAGAADGPGADARFKGLQALVASRVKAGRFYLAELGNHAIRTMDVDATGACTFGTLAGGTEGTADGSLVNARFQGPFGLAVGPDDTLYVAERTRVRMIAPDGKVSTLAGALETGTADGPGKDARFASPCGLALKGDQLFIADFGNHAIRRLDLADPAHGVTTVAGKAGQSGDVDGPAADARFKYPVALALDAEGRLLVADEHNGKVKRMAADGAVTTIAGMASPPSLFLDGPALTSGLANPRALAFGADGKLFLASSNVRTLEADGTLRSYAGLHPTQHGDGPHDGAFFTNVRGMAFGAGGVLYLADGTRVRAVTPPK